MNLENQFLDIKTRDEKRLFALNHVTNDDHKKILRFNKISLSTINILFYKFLNKSYKIKRKYQAKYKDEKKY